jgi:chloramphenicol 3-O phosphotransferase
MRAMLIVLNGTSSSGKTSLARALQALARRPLLHLEADRFVPALRSAPPADHPLWNEAQARPGLVIALHEAIAAFGRHGFDVVVDGSLPTEPGLRDRCLALLRAVPETRVIAVRCATGQLRQRELARGDRPAGWAAEQVSLVYDGVDFDATVDTTNAPAEEIARRLLPMLFPLDYPDGA